MLLSIGMIVKNESKYLRQCLEGLKPIIDTIEAELIIVDTGSTDDTLEISREFTRRVYEHKWNNNFAEARNITIDKSKGLWYLCVDGDEILQNPEEIISFFTTEKYKKYNSCAVLLNNILDNANEKKADKSTQGFYSKRLVKLDSSTKFIGKIHEQLPSNGPTYISKANFDHYGYVSNDEELMEYKFIRNKKILEEIIKEEPQNYYMLFQLATTYAMHKDNDDALVPIEQAYKVTKKLKVYPLYVYNLLAKIYIHKGLFADAEKICKEVVRQKKFDTTGYIDLYFYLASSQNTQKKYEQAINNYKIYINLVEKEKNKELEIDFSTVSYTLKSLNHTLLQLSNLSDIIGDLKNAIKYAKQIYEMTDDIKDNDQLAAVNQLVRLWIKYEKYEDIVRFYEKILKAISVGDKDSKGEEYFIIAMENQIRARYKIKNEMVKRIASLKIDTDYILLNKVRWLYMGDETLSQGDLIKIFNIEFKDNTNIYGELIYYLMKERVNIEKILSKLSEDNIHIYIKHIDSTFKDFAIVIEEYFNKYKDNHDINDTRLAKILKRVYLIKTDDENNNYKEMFNSYLIDGIKYLEHLYNKEILDNENINFMKNNEEVFLLYMRKALLKSDDNLKEYAQYLNKALKSYEYMKIGIELLKEDLEKRLDHLDSLEKERQDEFEEYKEIVKNNINALIEDEKLLEARMLVDEYLSIVPNDLEMLMIKSEIQVRII